MDPELVRLMNSEEERPAEAFDSDSDTSTIPQTVGARTTCEARIMATAAAFLHDAPDWEEAAEAASETFSSDSDSEFVPELHRVPNIELEGRGKRTKCPSLKVR